MDQVTESCSVPGGMMWTDTPGRFRIFGAGDGDDWSPSAKMRRCQTCGRKSSISESFKSDAEKECVGEMMGVETRQGDQQWDSDADVCNIKGWMHPVDIIMVSEMTLAKVELVSSPYANSFMVVINGCTEQPVHMFTYL